MKHSEHPSNQALERILISVDRFRAIEQEIRFHEHLRRYAAVRRFCYGRVIDFASGCGYGSFLLSVNPGVTQVVGIDRDPEAIEWAEKEYRNEKTEFRCQDIEAVSEHFDTLVSLEAIEHLEDVTVIPRLARRCGIDQIIISYPNKKSTHFNPYHIHDFTIQDIVDMMTEHVCYHDFTLGDVQFLLFIRKPPAAPHHIYRNIHELRR